MAIRSRRDANTRLRDFSIAQQLHLLRLSTGEARAARKILDDADQLLRGKIANLDLTAVGTRARLRALERSIREILDTQQTRLVEQTTTLVRDLGPEEATAQAEALDLILGLGVARVSAAQVVAAVRAFPLDGTILAAWLDRIARGDVERITSTIQRGVVAGDKTSDIVRSIVGSRRLLYRDGVREVTRRAVTSFVRAATIHVASVARRDLFAANADIVRAELWVATLDRRTCLVCGVLDGQEFPLGEGRRPPVHLSCRCTTTPLLKAWPQLPVEFQRASQAPDFTGEVPAATTYGEWLAARSPAFQDDVLGPARGRLLRSGEIAIDEFANSDQILTLDELRARRPSLFAEANL